MLLCEVERGAVGEYSDGSEGRSMKTKKLTGNKQGLIALSGKMLAEGAIVSDPRGGGELFIIGGAKTAAS